MPPKITLKKRIAVFSALWLLAGVLCAVFSDLSFEVGESELLTRLQIVYLAPLIAAVSVAFTVVHGHYDTSQQRDLYQAVVFWLVIGGYILHAIITLTRKNRRQFIALAVVQVLFLVPSVTAVLYFFHYDETRLILANKNRHGPGSGFDQD